MAEKSWEPVEVIEEIDETWDLRFAAIEQAIGTLQAVVITLTTDVSSLKKDVNSLQKDMAIVRAGINVLLARPTLIRSQERP
jgi:hypothetical protein